MARRGGIPPVLQIYKRCFKWVIEHQGKSSNEDWDDDIEGQEELMDKFDQMCESLFSHRHQADSEQNSSNQSELLRIIHHRQLHRCLCIVCLDNIAFMSFFIH